MSREELRRVEVLARVKSGQLGVVDAAQLMGGSGRRQQTIPGIELSAARCKSELRSWRPSRRNCHWPGPALRPALRPKRSALRAPQGCATGRANGTDKPGCCGSTEMEIVVPKALRTRDFSEKTLEKKKGKRTIREKPKHKRGTF
jgi:hypothetical protein